MVRVTWLNTAVELTTLVLPMFPGKTEQAVLSAELLLTATVVHARVTARSASCGGDQVCKTQ